jgi:hypothetical protein
MAPAVLMLGVLAVKAVTVLPPAAAELDLRPILARVGEASLESLPSEGRVFRFLWIPPFESQRTVCVRIQETPVGPVIDAKAVTSDGKVDAHVNRRLTTEEWDSLASAREHGFWKYHPDAFPQPVADGAIWVIEGQAAGERLRLVQDVPKPSPFRSLGYAMFRLTGIRLRATEASLSE